MPVTKGGLVKAYPIVKHRIAARGNTQIFFRGAILSGSLRAIQYLDLTLWPRRTAVRSKQRFMDELVKEQIRQWKAAMDEDNERVLEDKRNRTPAARMRGLVAFLSSHAYIGIEREKPASRAHRMPYSEIQERMSGRRGKHRGGN